MRLVFLAATKSPAISGLILGSPKIFVSLIAAQKMHGFAVFGQGAFDGVSDQKRSRGERLVPGIECGEVTIGAPPVSQAVEIAIDFVRHS